MAHATLLLVLLLTLTLTYADDQCSLTFTIDATQLQGVCQPPSQPQGLVQQELQIIQKQNAELKKELDSLRDEYSSMVDTVKMMEEETATWREIVEWPLRDAIFKPDNETLYINPDGPTYKECSDAVSKKRRQGIYTLAPGGGTDDIPFMAYCDSEGWTVVQRRFDGSEDFYRSWDIYMAGFGTLSGEMWLGLENVYTLTSQNIYDIRVEVLGYNGKMYYTENPDFRLEDEEASYRLHVSNMTAGNGKDLLSELNGVAFTSKDNDNDEWYNGNCAEYYRGGFWLKDCGFDMNREWCEGPGCMGWGDRSAKKSIIKIRPANSRGTKSVKSKPTKPRKPAKKPKKPKKNQG